MFLKCLYVFFLRAMWLRDSTNQIISYIPYAKDDEKLKKLILGVIYMQAEFIIKVKHFQLIVFNKIIFFQTILIVYRIHMQMHIMLHLNQKYLIQKIRGQKLILQLHLLQILRGKRSGNLIL